MSGIHRGSRRFGVAYMKPIKSLLVLAIVLSPALASAQGYYGNGGGAGYRDAHGFHHRMGRLIYGASLGLGGMSDNGNNISCDNCDYSPLALEGDFHLGGFVGPRFALMFEGQVNAQALHLSNDPSGNGDSYVTQSAAMIAGQYWLTPQLWIKGGIGAAHLSVDNNYYSQELDNGFALMGGVGFELLSTRFFAFDLQGRLISGNYRGIDDHVTSATVGLGINWY